MPIHVGELTSEVTVADGGLPLTEAQLDELVRRVLQRLADAKREARLVREATAIRPASTPPPMAGEGGDSWA